MNNIDQKANNTWVIWRGVFKETEGCICSIEDYTVPTRNYRQVILKEGGDGPSGLIGDKCWWTATEILEHINKRTFWPRENM